MTAYVDLLREKKLTVTPQRLEIVNILSLHGHLNIDELYKLLSVSFPSLSLATVYKNIHTMLEKLFLSEVQIPHKKNVYELIKDEHAHVVCSKCNTILDIYLDTSSLIQEAQSKSNFTLESNNLVFNGICSSCEA
ncbi:MAG: transcriptional repressor [Sulfurimonas sp.]|nr:transcriptional repressor [Sulfurimonas sp.]MDQ7062381.1 transcriptional repressor [Sulfurimonas sp.]